MYHHKKIYKTIYDENEIIIHSKYAEMVVYNKNKKLLVQVDLDDVEKIKKYKWSVTKAKHFFIFIQKQLERHH